LDEDVGIVVFVVDPKSTVVKHLGAIDNRLAVDGVSVEKN